MVPTANFLITPGVLFCLVIFPHWRYKLFPHGAEDSHFLTSSTIALFSPSCDERSSLTNYLFLLSFDDGNMLWSKSLEIFCSHLTVTALQDDGSKFSWLSKSPTCAGSTLEDAGKSGFVPNEQSLKLFLLLKGKFGLKKCWEVKSRVTKMWTSPSPTHPNPHVKKHWEIKSTAN